MDITIPVVLKSLSTGGSAIKYLRHLHAKATGDSRAIISEIKENLSYLDMIALDEVPLCDVVDNLSITEYKRLSKEGYNFNKLKNKSIAKYKSLMGTDLERWIGKDTETLIESIYEKINEIKIRHPYVGNSPKYRWSVRVNNIRKRIWLLLKHISA